MQVSVIRQRQGIHAVVMSTFDQLLDRARTIEKAVVAVAMKMNKSAVRPGLGDPSWSVLVQEFGQSQMARPTSERC